MQSRSFFPLTVGEHRLIHGEPITGDASPRKYWRVTLADRSGAVLCLYPPNASIERDRDVEVLRWLAECNIPVPAVLAADASSQAVLLEDLGPRDAEAALAELSGNQRQLCAARFLDPITTLSAIAPEILPRWNRPLDQDLLRWELSGFELWAVAFRQRTTPGRSVNRFLDALAESISRHPQRICFRDYHLNNILIDDHDAVRIIDVQDILVGPDTYDLASLLGDRQMPTLLDRAGRDFIAGTWADSTRAAAGWEARLAQVALQRALKVIGTFCRLTARGIGDYRCWIPIQAALAVTLAGRLEMCPELHRILLDLAFAGGLDVR